MRSRILLTLIGAAVLVSGCSNSGAFIATNSTQVQLDNGDYKIVAKSISGEAESAYILGLSYSRGLISDSFGLIRLDGSTTPYKDAREQLWANFEAEYGAVEGRKLALVNVQFDGDNRNFILYTSSKVVITADVIEFED